MNFFRNIFGRKKERSDEKELQKADLELKFARAAKLLNKFKRKAYLPITQENNNEFSISSKIGGYPYLRNEHDWPVCPNCNRNMQLFLQLNLNELPERKQQGLIQLFYCTTEEPHCESDKEAFFPFSEAVCCRKINIEGHSVQINPNLDRIFKEKVIIGWSEADDYPHFEEYGQLGLEIELDDELYELLEERQMGLPIERDKLFGWPHWVQSVEYPFDRKTETQMELLFQLDSEDNLPYMFGDAGIGHLTQSPDNEDELGFGWACT